MAKAFEFKRGDLDKLRKFYRKAPTMFKWAGVGLSNNLAFRLLRETLNELEQSMTIRSPVFVKGSVRVKKANFGNRTAEVGSIARERFTGWVEQETGKKTKRTRTQTRVARRSNWKNRVAPRFRLKRGAKKFMRPSDLQLDNTKASDIPIFLQILSRRKFRQPYFIPIAYKRLQRGIYIFRANKIRRIQNLNPDDPQPKRNRWMTKSVREINQAAVEQEWQKAITFSMGNVRL